MIGRPGRRYVKQERLIEARAGRPRRDIVVHRFIDSLCLRTLPQVSYLRSCLMSDKPKGYVSLPPPSIHIVLLGLLLLILVVV